MIKVAILCHNHLFCEGLLSLLEDDSEIKVINRPDETLESFVNKKADIFVIETALFVNIFQLLKDKQVKILVLCTDWRKDSFNLFAHGNVTGILPPDTSSEVLKKAIKKVNKGEVWIARKTIKDILFLRRSFGAGLEIKDELTERETDVAKLVAHGNSNKEVAKTLQLSEQTVKVHLNSIYKKIGVRNRVGLAMNQFLSKAL